MDCLQQSTTPGQTSFKESPRVLVIMVIIVKIVILVSMDFIVIMVIMVMMVIMVFYFILFQQVGIAAIFHAYTFLWSYW
jgi:hypothetical protein